MRDHFTHYAADIGRSHGTAAAQWVFDGNTDDGTYRRVLAGIEDGDPEILDAYHVPDLSEDYTTGDLGSELAQDSEADGHDADLGVAYGAYRQAARDAFWQETERIAREHIDSAAIAELQAAGYEITYVDRADVTIDGKVPPYAHYHHDRSMPGLAAYANLGPAGRDDFGHGLATTTERSNYRSLVRDFDGAFIPVDHADTDGLGAFVADLPADLVKILATLPDHPVYDEGDLSSLESEEIAETWDQYVRDEITSELHDADEAAAETWETLGEAQQRGMFWQAVDALEIYPEHDGHDVHWTVHYPAITAELARSLTTAVR